MFRIFTDNAANLPGDVIRRYGLDIVTIQCFLEGEPFEASEDFDGKTFYDKMRAGAQTGTSMPSMGAFLDAFRASLEKGEDVLYIGMSGGISGTAALAKSVVLELREVFPDRRIESVDTRGASLGEGLPVLYAAGLREAGKDFDEVVRLTEENCDHMWQVFTVDDLKYLHKTGRLYSAAVRVTNVLQMKPILMGDPEGHIVLRQVTVGRRRSLETLAARYRDKCTDKTAPVGIAHADSPEDTEYVIRKLREYGCEAEIMEVVYEPVTGSHVGPGTVALFFYGEMRS